MRNRSKEPKHVVIVIDHKLGDTVYCWGRTAGLQTIRSCLLTHPNQPIAVRQIEMTEAEYDALPDYEGDC